MKRENKFVDVMKRKNDFVGEMIENMWATAKNRNIAKFYGS